MSLTDLSPIKDKVANEGANEQGVLTSENWNMLVEAVDEVQGATIVDVVPSITPNSSFVSITLSLKTGKDTVKQYQITIPACDENNSGVFTPEQLQSFKALIQAAQNSIEAETNARQTADTALQTEIDAAIGTISTDEINSIPASIEDAVAMAKDTKHSRWTLIYSNRTVGVIDLFSDNNGHQLTEILTTNFVIHDNNWNQTEHRDGEIRRYFRTYNINSPYLKNEKGTWTDWAEHVAATVRTELDDLDEAAAAAQKTADAALEASAMVLKDTAALKDAVGKAGGIAMLDGDMKIPVANLPEKAVGVLEFQGTVQGVSALDMSTTQYAGVAFDTVARCFYAYTVSGSGLTGTRIYYKSWNGWQHYQDGTPYSGKIYMDTTTDTPYRWNGTTMKTLVPKTVALTQEEYDDMAAAGTLDDDTYYNILEE